MIWPLGESVAEPPTLAPAILAQAPEQEQAERVWQPEPPEPAWESEPEGVVASALVLEARELVQTAPASGPAVVRVSQPSRPWAQAWPPSAEG